MRNELENALTAARTLPSEQLPRFLGDLEEIRMTVLARFAPSPPAGATADQLLDIDEASRRLGMSKSFVYRNSSKFGFTRHIGRGLRFSRDGIERYIKARC